MGEVMRWDQASGRWVCRDRARRHGGHVNVCTENLQPAAREDMASPGPGKLMSEQKLVGSVGTRQEEEAGKSHVVEQTGQTERDVLADGDGGLLELTVRHDAVRQPRSGNMN